MEFTFSNFTLPSESNEELDRLIQANSTVYHLAPKTIFCDIGEDLGGVYYISKGRTSHYIVGRDGGEKLLYTLSTGWFFGEPATFLDQPSTLRSRADMETTLYRLEYQDFHRLVDTSPLFRNAVLQDNSKKMLIMRHEIENITFCSYKERLTKLFYVAADRTELVDGMWYKQRVQYTQNDLSIVIGSSRITVSKLLGELCEEGVIRILNRRVQVSAKVGKEIWP